MTIADEIKAIQARQAAALKNVANDVRDLLTRATTPGISQADAEAIKADGEKVAVGLETLAAEYEPPVIEPVPGEEPSNDAIGG